MSKFPFDRDNTSTRYAKDMAEGSSFTHKDGHSGVSHFLLIQEDVNRREYSRPKGQIAGPRSSH